MNTDKFLFKMNYPLLTRVIVRAIVEQGIR